MDGEEAVEFDENEDAFHDYIRTQIVSANSLQINCKNNSKNCRIFQVCLIIFLALYGISFAIIQYYKTRSDSDELYAGDEDFFVYRISYVRFQAIFFRCLLSSFSVWMCSCSLAVSIGAVTLLPFSVFGYEVSLSYPDNYYLKWLNWSLISSLWNYVFLLSNISLFFLLPYAYFFIESQGLSFQQRPKPFIARVYETTAVCILVIVILVSLANVFYSLFLSETLFVVFSLIDLSHLSIPLVYSLVSLVGVFLLLLSVPVGLAKMFDVSSRTARNPLTTIVLLLLTVSLEFSFCLLLQSIDCKRTRARAFAGHNRRAGARKHASAAFRLSCK